MLLWRVERGEHVKETLKGKGAEMYGGRWNSDGVPLVYASTTLSLAAYERFVHAPLLSRNVQLFAIGIEVADATVNSAIRPTPLPEDWRSPEPSTSTMKWGKDWAMTKQSLLAAVPSVLLPLDFFVHSREYNVLINSLHTKMSAVRIADRQPFAFDLRAWKDER